MCLLHGRRVRAAFGIKICELESSKVYLFKEQSHLGRVIVAHKKHVSEITELTAQERAAYMEDINRVACAMHEIPSLEVCTMNV